MFALLLFVDMKYYVNDNVILNIIGYYPGPYLGGELQGAVAPGG
jgi:hypothetical protein